MDSKRRVWQHEIEDISETQLVEVFSKTHLVVERLRHDYGEDLFARPFLSGNPTGDDFFIQLKGTDNIDQYRLITDNELSYSIDLANLAQWGSFSIPVIIILWDVKNRLGYWLHIQPLIKDKLKGNHKWLKNDTRAKSPTRTVRIPISQCVKESDIDNLMLVIEKEWQTIKRGKSEFELSYKADSNLSDKTLSPNLSTSIRRQLKIVELQIAAQEKPQEYEMWLNLASAYYDFDNKSEALRAIGKAWDLAPKNKNVKQVRACILAEFAIANDGIPSMLREAIKLFKSTKSNTTSPIADYNIGNSYGGLKQHKDALKHFDIALANKPNSQLAAQIFTNRGNELDMVGKQKEAVQSFKNAIKHNSKLWNAYASWAALEVRRKNFKAANKHFRRAFRCNPELHHTNYDVTYWFAYSLCQVGELKEALSIVDQILAENPLHKISLELKSYILAKLLPTDKNYTFEARSFFTKRLEDDPSNMMARSELNKIYIDQELNDQRRKLVEDTISFDNAPAMAFYDYAVILEDEGRIADAIVHLEKAIKKDPSSHLTAHMLARLKRENGQYQDAITYYKLALKNGKESSSILNSVANCYHFLGEYEKSLKVLMLSLLIDSRKIQTWNNLGFALNKLEAYEMSSVCAVTIKNLQQNNNTGEKILEEIIKVLLHEIEVLYGKDFSKRVKAAKRHKNYLEL